MTDHDNDKLDLSALDPMEDAEHWRRVVASTKLRVDAVMSRRTRDPFATIAGWSRPLLIAACAALVLLVPVEFALEAREAQAEQVDRLVSLSVDVVHADTPPSSTDFLGALTPKSAR